jgi:hypothetical protein
MLTPCNPLPHRHGARTAPPCRRGPCPRPPVAFKYNLHLRIRVSPLCTRDNMVSDDIGSSTMPSAGSGLGKKVPSSGDDLSKRLDRLEELVRSISDNLCAVKQQQQGLSVIVLHLEKNSSSAGDDTLVNGNAASLAARAGAVSGGQGDDHSTVPPGEAGWPLHHHRRRGTGSDLDAVGDHLPASVHKIEFPKFDGMDDPMAWLNRCEHYFALHGTPKHQRVQYVRLFLPPG